MLFSDLARDKALKLIENDLDENLWPTKLWVQCKSALPFLPESIQIVLLLLWVQYCSERIHCILKIVSFYHQFIALLLESITLFPEFIAFILDPFAFVLNSVPIVFETLRLDCIIFTNWKWVFKYYNHNLQFVDYPQLSFGAKHVSFLAALRWMRSNYVNHIIINKNNILKHFYYLSVTLIQMIFEIFCSVMTIF